MALSEIIDIAEIIADIGKGVSLTEAEYGLLASSKQRAESHLRKFVGTDITQATYSGEYYPKASLMRRRFSCPVGPFLVLDHWPLRTITTIHEDIAGQFGQASTGDTAFDAADLLVEGDDYMRVLEFDDYGMNAMVERINRSWEDRSGSIKVTYVAGWTDAELDGDTTDPRTDATALRDIAARWTIEDYTQKVRTQSGGEVTSGRLGDFTWKMNEASSGVGIAVTPEIEDLAAPFMRLGTTTGR